MPSPRRCRGGAVLQHTCAASCTPRAAPVTLPAACCEGNEERQRCETASVRALEESYRAQERTALRQKARRAPARRKPPQCDSQPQLQPAVKVVAAAVRPFVER